MTIRFELRTLKKKSGGGWCPLHVSVSDGRGFRQRRVTRILVDPAWWDREAAELKRRVPIPEAERAALDREMSALKTYLMDAYAGGGEQDRRRPSWLAEVLAGFYAGTGRPPAKGGRGRFDELFSRFADGRAVSPSRRRHYHVLARMIHRFERYVRLSDPGRARFVFDIDRADAALLGELRDYLRDEHLHVARFPGILAGCQKFPGFNGKEIRFSARSLPEAGTKAVYTGDKSDNNFERIDWVAGDKIRIFNDVATCSGDPSYKWADYTVTSVDGSTNRYSKGHLTVTSDRGGLVWGSGEHIFYGVYPSPETPDAGDTHDLSLFNGTIQQTQTGKPSDINAWTGTGKVYYPSNNKPILVGYAQLDAGVDDGTLDFEPAYTAFHISAGHKDGDPNITIKSVTLKAASGNALAGNFTTSRSSSGWTFGCPAYASSNNAITFTFADGNHALSGTDKVEFVLYALPQNLTNLTLDFLVDVDGVGTDLHRTLELKAAAAGTHYEHTYAAGESLIFNACRKAYIKGLLIPGSVWTVDDTTPVVLRESVAPWDDNTQNPKYGTDLVVNASGLDEVNLSTHSYRFSIYEPEGKIWKIKVLNSSGAVVPGVTITRDNHPGTADPTSGSGELTGTIRKGLAATPSLIEFSLSGSTGGSNCTLSFSVIADGKEYSINSEVVRGTWGSGYQYINLP